MAELTAPFVWKNEEKRIVYGPVLIPNEPDTDGDVVTADKIETVAHKFIEEYGNIDIMHTLNNVGRVVESYILPMDWRVAKNTVIPKGSWILGVRVTDDNTWQAVKDGRLRGFSIMALKDVAAKSVKSTKSNRLKRVTLKDLGDNWFVNAVSLVDEPAVPKAKFLAIKSKAKQVKKSVAGSFEERKELIEKALFEMLSDYEGYLYIHSTLEDSVIFELEDENGVPKMFQIGYEMDEENNVTFIGEPVEVEIQEVIVPVDEEPQTDENDESEEEQEDETEEDEEQQAEKNSSFVSKLFGKMGKSRKASEKQLNSSEVKNLIKKEIEPINHKLDELINALKSQVVEEQTPNNPTGSVNKSKEDNENQEQENVYKQKYEELLRELESYKSRLMSKRLTGQDNHYEKTPNEEDAADRDIFGYKIKKR